jgi:hypothetical protein
MYTVSCYPLFHTIKVDLYLRLILYSAGSGYWPVIGFYLLGNEISGSVKREKQLSSFANVSFWERTAVHIFS